nr:DUF3783 domain protein [Tanacetum cinerariifolium]
MHNSSLEAQVTLEPTVGLAAMMAKAGMSKRWPLFKRREVNTSILTGPACTICLFYEGLYVLSSKPVMMPCGSGTRTLMEALSVVPLYDELQQARATVAKAEADVILEITHKMQTDLDVDICSYMERSGKITKKLFKYGRLVAYFTAAHIDVIGQTYVFDDEVRIFLERWQVHLGLGHAHLVVCSKMLIISVQLEATYLEQMEQFFSRIEEESCEEAPSKMLEEDSKFVPLNPDDSLFGPPALLLIGFQVDEVAKIQKFLIELEGEFLEPSVGPTLSTQDLCISFHITLAMSTQQDINAIRAQRFANTHDPLALMANTQTPFHLDHSSLITYIQHPQPNNNFVQQPSFNTNYMQQPMQNPKDILDPTITIDMTLELIVKAVTLNNTTPTNNNQRSSSNPSNMQIAQPSMNMDQDRQMLMVENNVGNLFGPNAVQNVRNQYGNRNVVTTPVKGNRNGINEEEEGIQSTQEEFEFMAAADAYEEIERVKANYILENNLQQASTSGTQSDKAPVYNSDRSAEVHLSENCYDNDIFNMFTQEEQYTELLEPIPEPHQVPQNDSNVIYEVSSMEQVGRTIEQHSANVKETRAYHESLFHNLAAEVEKSTCDSDQEINANMVFMAQIENVLSASDASSSSADEKIYEFRKYVGQNAGNLNGYNEVQNVENQVAQNPRDQNFGN